MTTNGKGQYFEQVVREWLFKQGHFPTAPAHDGAHPIDIFCVRKDGKVYAIDAKAKAVRRMWRDTGIDYRHYNKYHDIERQAGIDVWVFFGDHVEAWVYGATLAELRKPVENPPGAKPGMYPRIEGGIIYFPLSSMHRLFPLSAEQCAQLRELSKGDTPQGELL